MSEFEKQPSGEAARLISSPVLTEILEGIEGDAMEQSVLAQPSDDETRRTAMNMVRAVRLVREQLTERANGRLADSETVPLP